MSLSKSYSLHPCFDVLEQVGKEVIKQRQDQDRDFLIRTYLTHVQSPNYDGIDAQHPLGMVIASLKVVMKAYHHPLTFTWYGLPDTTDFMPSFTTRFGFNDYAITLARETRKEEGRDEFYKYSVGDCLSLAREEEEFWDNLDRDIDEWSNDYHSSDEDVEVWDCIE